MAEIKTGIFAKNVQKRLNRAQEKVLQKLGKADETKDEQFEQCVINFKRQESEGFRLQREMKAYLAAVKAMQQASMNLTESLHEVYEPDWHGKDDVMTIGKSCDVLWEDFHQRLVDCSISALDMYLTKFPDLKVRVAKRSRKLIDYDSARHHLETLQTSTMRNEKKIAKAEEDLKKAQRVFDDLNVGLQDELPTLWDSRVGFYVTTFKDVSSLEAKFHREISVLCHKLYEVMNKLAEQHSDKMFTIQGAPSDSGPLRLARTPTPPDDESPPGSPEASPNHLLRPTSPGPPRPKSPSQLKKGPPVPPPPKVTPTRELEQEQILDLFDSSFPVTTPSANERPGESLLDLDFDPFKPDSATPIGQTQSPMSQALPWDLWAATDAGFTANWAADFGTPAAGMEGSTGAAAPATDGWPPRRRLGSRGCTVPVAPESPADAESPASPEATVAPEAEAAAASEAEGTEVRVATPPAGTETEEPAVTSPPGDTAAVSSSTQLYHHHHHHHHHHHLHRRHLHHFQHQRHHVIFLSLVPKSSSMPIPSVVIEPASSNEGDDDRDGDIISPTATSDSTMSPEGQTAKDISSSASAVGMPPGFLYKVETMHDFEAANSDELELKMGDVVLVIPTDLAEDQDAGWLTGIREADWLQRGTQAQKGLFPENFTQRLE
uniref:Amphiphysin n=1 Tax=Denticeps clupeoides TaxID=299321 RepID=A0AAY4DU02_9TELE